MCAKQKTGKSLGAALMRILAAIAVAGPAGSTAAAPLPPVTSALEPCPLPLPTDAIEPAALSAEDLVADALRLDDGLVLRARLARPPAANTGFGCPIERTIS
jgi:hypothetical protein